MMARSRNGRTVDDIVFQIPMQLLLVGTVTLPAVSLAICFFSALIFRFDDVIETLCGERNFIPSASAVTGITPQAYIWRTCIALHTAPRFAFTFAYYSHYLGRHHLIASHRKSLFKILVRFNLLVSLVENSCLAMVAYVTNRENYPVHEKMFIMFMISSVLHLLCETFLFKWTRNKEMSEAEKRSFFWKKVGLATNVLGTLGLILSFILYEFYCFGRAFSLFSACEYIIGYSNMGYHSTTYLDFKDKQMMIGTFGPDKSLTNGSTSSNNHSIKSKKQQ